MAKLEFTGFGGLKLAAVAYGSPEDPPVLMVPPIGQVSEYWAGSARALGEAGRYAISLDLRGHGESGWSGDAQYDLNAYVADLKALLASLPRRAFVVASGFGAIIAILAVGEGGPHMVSGMALVDANIRFESGTVERLGGGLRRRVSAFEDEAAVVDAIVALHPSEPRPADIGPLLAAFGKSDDGRLAWRGDKRAVSGVNLEAEQERLAVAAEQIFAPVMIIRGELNGSVSADAAGYLQSLIKGSEVAEISGAGHYGPLDRADAFNAIMLDFLERHDPRQPLSVQSGTDPRVLRDALGCFATGVTIITTMDEQGEPIGLTANSFTSVSLDPPLILFSLAKKSVNLNVFEQAGKFAVNVLHIGQQPAAGRFASPVEKRFDGVDWALATEGGSPILASALASFDCETYAVHEGGDHLIFVGKVNRAWYEPNRDPLLYFRGRFRRLHFA